LKSSWNALVARLQQVLMLVDHTETENSIEGYNKLGEIHAMPKSSISKISVEPPGMPG